MCGPDIHTPPSPPLAMASLLLDNQASLLSHDDEKGVFLPSKLNGQGKNERNMTMAHRYPKELCLGDYVYWG